MSEIGSLVVTLEANMAKYATDMDRAASIANQRMGEINDSVDTVKRAFEAFGIAIGVDAFVDLIKGSIEASDRLVNLNASTNLSIETLAGLSFLAKTSGTDMDSLAKGINMMSVEMGKAPEKFKDLGITATDTGQAFSQFADIFNLLPDINQRNALAQAVFKRSWAELAPIMVMGSTAIQEAITKGALLSGQTEAAAHAAKDFNDKWIELTGTGGIGTRMMQGMLPALNGIADELLVLQTNGMGTSTMFTDIGSSIGTGLVTVRDFTVTLWDHRQAIEVLAGAYASWKLGTFVSELANAAVTNYLNVAATMAAKDAVVQKAVADVAATAATATLTAARVAELRVAVLAAEGEVALAIVTNGLVPAQAAAAAAAVAHTGATAALTVAEYEASIATGALNTALSFLGGPIGILITLIGAAATAFFVFGQQGKTAVQGITDEVEKGIAVIERLKKEMKFGSGDVGQLTASLEAINRSISVLAASPGEGAAKKLAELRAQAKEFEEMLANIGQKQAATSPVTPGLTAAQLEAQRRAAEFLKVPDTGHDPWAIRMASQIKVSNASIAMIKANLQQEEAVLKNSYSDQYIDADTYYAKKAAALARAISSEGAEYAKQYAAVEQYVRNSKDKNKAEKETAERMAINSANAKSAAESDRAVINNADEKARIYRDFALAMEAVSHQYALAADQSNFEIDMIGRTQDVVEKLTAARVIQLAVEDKLYQARNKNIPKTQVEETLFAARWAQVQSNDIISNKQAALLHDIFSKGTKDVALGAAIGNENSQFAIDQIGKTAVAIAQENAARQIRLSMAARFQELEKLGQLHKLSPPDRLVAEQEAQAQEAQAKRQIAEQSRRNNDEIFRLGTEETTHSAALADAAAKSQLDMMGKNSLAVAQLNAVQSIELALQARLYDMKLKDATIDPAKLADAALQAEQQKLLAITRVTTAYEKQRSAQFGVSEAFRKYSEDATNSAAQMEALFTKAFKGMEDGLVEFVKTGKLDFSSLADSIISDLIRIAIQQQITGPLAAAFSSGGGSVVTSFLSMLGFAGGGDPPMGKPSLVGENGPELFMPHSAGTIIPNSKLGGASDIVVNIIESPGNGGQTARRSTGGIDYLDVFVEKVKNSLAGDITRGAGVVPNAMASTYGLNRVAGVY